MRQTVHVTITLDGDERIVLRDQYDFSAQIVIGDNIILDLVGKDAYESFRANLAEALDLIVPEMEPARAQVQENATAATVA